MASGLPSLWKSWLKWVCCQCLDRYLYKSCVQALYQLREGGEGGHGDSGELYSNVWMDNDTPLLRLEPTEDHVAEPPPLSPCEGIVCMNNGSCVVEDGYARCDCPLGYSGSYCERGE